MLPLFWVIRCGPLPREGRPGDLVHRRLYTTISAFTRLSQGAMARLPDNIRTSYNDRCNEMSSTREAIPWIQTLCSSCQAEELAAKLSELCPGEWSVLKNNQNFPSAKAGKVLPCYVYKVYIKHIMFMGKLCLDLGPISKLSHTCKLSKG